VAANLTDEDITDLAAYLASRPVKVAAK
jgi:cytochrome c553